MNISYTVIRYCVEEQVSLSSLWCLYKPAATGGTAQRSSDTCRWSMGSYSIWSNTLYTCTFYTLAGPSGSATLPEIEMKQVGIPDSNCTTHHPQLQPHTNSRYNHTLQVTPQNLTIIHHDIHTQPWLPSHILHCHTVLHTYTHMPTYTPHIYRLPLLPLQPPPHSTSCNTHLYVLVCVVGPETQHQCKLQVITTMSVSLYSR